MEPRLRPAVEADSEFLFALHRAAFGPVAEAIWGAWDDAVQRVFHRSWFADPRRLSIVLLDGEPVGVIDARARADAVLYLARLELLPAVQRRGLGTALMLDLMARARRAGCLAVELDVRETNEDARRFYERLEFRCQSVSGHKARMRRSLPPPG